MTVEAWTRAPIYPIQSQGPYSIPHPYVDGAVRVAVLDAEGTETLLQSADFYLVPEATDDAGSLTLTSDAFAAHSGKRLKIDRITEDEQGWEGRLGQREKGLERQLDRMVMSDQEQRETLTRTIRFNQQVHAGILPEDGRSLIWDDAGRRFVPGPKADEIARAQGFAEAAHRDADRAEQARDETEEILNMTSVGRLWFLGQTEISARFGTAEDTIISDPGPGPYPSVTIEVLT